MTEKSHPQAQQAQERESAAPQSPSASLQLKRTSPRAPSYKRHDVVNSVINRVSSNRAGLCSCILRELEFTTYSRKRGSDMLGLD